MHVIGEHIVRNVPQNSAQADLVARKLRQVDTAVEVSEAMGYGSFNARDVAQPLDHFRAAFGSQRKARDGQQKLIARSLWRHRHPLVPDLEPRPESPEQRATV